MQVYRQLGHMVLVCMVMVQVMVCLMAAESIRGFAEALAEVSVGAGAEAAVVAEVDLVTRGRAIGSRFKL